MDNVVPLRGSGEQQKKVFGPEHAPALVRAMHDLWVTGQISASAFHLGAQIAQRFQETGLLKTVLIPDEASRRFVETENGYMLAGLPFVVEQDYITALQELHFTVGILNHFLDSELETEDVESLKGHFTLDPMLSAGIDFTIKTPIFFKFDPQAMDALAEHAKLCVTAMREQFKGSVLRRV